MQLSKNSNQEVEKSSDNLPGDILIVDLRGLESTEADLGGSREFHKRVCQF